MKNMHTDLRVQKVNAVETRQSIHRIIRLLGSIVDFTYLLVNTTGQSTMALIFYKYLHAYFSQPNKGRVIDCS